MIPRSTGRHTGSGAAVVGRRGAVLDSFFGRGVELGAAAPTVEIFENLSPKRAMGASMQACDWKINSLVITLCNTKAQRVLRGALGASK